MEKTRLAAVLRIGPAAAAYDETSGEEAAWHG